MDEKSVTTYMDQKIGQKDSAGGSSGAPAESNIVIDSAGGFSGAPAESNIVVMPKGKPQNTATGGPLGAPAVTDGTRGRHRKHLSGAQQKKRKRQRLRAGTAAQVDPAQSTASKACPGGTSPLKRNIPFKVTGTGIGEGAGPSREVALVAAPGRSGQPSQSDLVTAKGKNKKKGGPGSSAAAASTAGGTQTKFGRPQKVGGAEVGGTKRALSAGAGSSPGANPGRAAKVRRVGPSPKKTSYREAATSHLRVAIIDRSSLFGRITSDQSALIENMLTRELDNQMSLDLVNIDNRPQDPIMFGGLFFSGEILRVTCGNDRTLNWLQGVVSTNSALWEGACLEMVQVDLLPRLTKATIFLPGNPEDDGLVMRRLRAQNPSIKIQTWLRFHEATKQEGKLLVFGIGEEDRKAILSRGGKLNYKFSSVAVKLQSPSAATENAVAPVDVPEGSGAAVSDTARPTETATAAMGHPDPGFSGSAETRSHSTEGTLGSGDVEMAGPGQHDRPSLTAEEEALEREHLEEVTDALERASETPIRSDLPSET